jgi:hypothetical protein
MPGPGHGRPPRVVSLVAGGVPGGLAAADGVANRDRVDGVDTHGLEWLGTWKPGPSTGPPTTVALGETSPGPGSASPARYQAGLPALWCRPPRFRCRARRDLRGKTNFDARYDWPTDLESAGSLACDAIFRLATSPPGPLTAVTSTVSSDSPGLHKVLHIF